MIKSVNQNTLLLITQVVVTRFAIHATTALTVVIFKLSKQLIHFKVQQMLH